MLQIILAILAFGILVIVHEFGHFITAKRGGVQVNEFWIGMGPTLLKKQHNGTLYCLKLLPFGGACVMEGEDGESENERAFGKASLPRRMLIGLNFAEQPNSIGMHLNMAARTSVNYARLVWSSLGMLVTGQVGVDQLSGPVGVAEVMASTARYSISAFLQLVAFISINLGVMNLLPLPALDGGRLVFLLIEAVRRKPVPPKYEGYIHAAGLMLLLALMVYVTGQDILRIVSGR